MPAKYSYVEPTNPKNEASFSYLGDWIPGWKPNTETTLPHIHSAVEMIYVDKGGFYVALDEVEYTITEGDFIIFCSNAVHGLHTMHYAENKHYLVKVSPSYLMNFWSQNESTDHIMRFAINRPEYKCLWTKSELETNPIKPILDMLIYEFNNKTATSMLAIKLKIAELMLEIIRQDPFMANSGSSQLSYLVFDAMSYTKKHLSEDIDEKQLAERLGISYSYFSRAFKNFTGRSFRQHLNITRVNLAEQLLSSSNRSVSEIAIECGYNSISYFINVYRKIKGETPYKTQQKRMRNRK